MRLIGLCFRDNIRKPAVSSSSFYNNVYTKNCTAPEGKHFSYPTTSQAVSVLDVQCLEYLSNDQSLLVPPKLYLCASPHLWRSARYTHGKLVLPTHDTKPRHSAATQHRAATSHHLSLPHCILHVKADSRSRSTPAIGGYPADIPKEPRLVGRLRGCPTHFHRFFRALSICPSTRLLVHMHVSILSWHFVDQAADLPS